MIPEFASRAEALKEKLKSKYGKGQNGKLQRM